MSHDMVTYRCFVLGDGRSRPLGSFDGSGARGVVGRAAGLIGIGGRVIVVLAVAVDAVLVQSHDQTGIVRARVAVCVFPHHLLISGGSVLVGRLLLVVRIRHLFHHVLQAGADVGRDSSVPVFLLQFGSQS